MPSYSFDNLLIEFTVRRAHSSGEADPFLIFNRLYEDFWCQTLEKNFSHITLHRECLFLGDDVVLWIWYSLGGNK